MPPSRASRTRSRGSVSGKSSKPRTRSFGRISGLPDLFGARMGLGNWPPGLEPQPRVVQPRHETHQHSSHHRPRLPVVVRKDSHDVHSRRGHQIPQMTDRVEPVMAVLPFGAAPTTVVTRAENQTIET